jgi:hypothetical protein
MEILVKIDILFLLFVECLLYETVCLKFHKFNQLVSFVCTATSSIFTGSGTMFGLLQLTSSAISNSHLSLDNACPY